MSENTQEQKKQKPLSINGIDNEAKQEFALYAKENGLPQADLFKILWTNFQSLYIPLSPEERELVAKANITSSKTIKTKLKKSLLRLSLNATQDKVIDTDISVDKNIKNSARSADLRVIDIVNEIMLTNDTEEKWYNLRFLSQKAIFDYARECKAKDPSKLGLSIAVINRYVQHHQEEINQHHERHCLDENHNRKAHYERMKLTTKNEG